jgi:enoyl-CoA hydratase/carnithine racemase
VQYGSARGAQVEQRTRGMQDEKIIGHRDGPVGHVVFNNPAKLNAVSLDMWERVHALLTEYAEDAAIRAVVVSGAGGKAFVSGADISKFESERANMEAQKRYDAISSKSYDFLYSFPKPTLAKITGYCIGGGMNLAGCCDLRFCNEGARFGVPAAKLGLGYGFERVRRLSESIGLPKTLEVIYTGRQFSAQEALDMGFVQRVVADSELDAAVAETTALIAQNAPLTIALAKAAAREVGKAETERNFARLDAMVKACFDSQDYVEGRRAFMEKRKPNFKGK